MSSHRRLNNTLGTVGTAHLGYAIAIAIQDQLTTFYTSSYYSRSQDYPNLQPIIMTGIKVVFGGANLQRDRPFGTVEAVKEILTVLKENSVDTIDSAQLYGASEELLGEASAGDSFIIDTKATGGFVEGSGTKDGIISGAKESLRRLALKKVCS